MPRAEAGHSGGYPLRSRCGAGTVRRNARLVTGAVDLRAGLRHPDRMPSPSPGAERSAGQPCQEGPRGSKLRYAAHPGDQNCFPSVFQCNVRLPAICGNLSPFPPLLRCFMPETEGCLRGLSDPVIHFAGLRFKREPCFPPGIRSPGSGTHPSLHDHPAVLPTVAVPTLWHRLGLELSEPWCWVF